MNRSTCLLIAVLSVTAAGQPALGEGPTTLPTQAGKVFVHEASGTVFPPNVASFVRESVHSFDAENQDVSVGYNDPDIRIVATVYVYPAESRGSLKDQIKNIASNVLVIQPGARQISSGDRKVTQGGREFSGQEAVFEVTQTMDGQPIQLRSRAILLVDGKNVVKFRITYLKAEADDAEKRIDTFLTTLTLP